MYIINKIKENKGFLVLLFLIVSIKSSVLDWNNVPTGSMRPILADGDQILINKLAYDITIPLTHKSIYKISNPERGDIVVFDSVAEDLRMVKRIMGLPGDTLKIENNILYINGVKATYQDNYTSEQIGSTFKGLDDASREYYKSYNIDVDVIRFDYKLETILGVTHPIRLEQGYVLDKKMNTTIVIPEGKYFALGDNRNNSKDSRFWGFVDRSEVVGKVNHVVFSLNQSNYYLPRLNRFFVNIK